MKTRSVKNTPHASVSNPEPMAAPLQPLADFGDRLVTLCDGRPGLRGALPVEVRTPGPADGQSPAPSGAIIDFIASSETLDRYQEILVASGWKLDNYRRNPVFQNAHQYGDIIFTLGKALITEVRTGPPREAPHGLSTLNSQPSTVPATYLFQRVEFATEVNPMARIAYGLYRGQFLNAVSVGFIPLRWEDGQGTSRSFRRKYLEQELLEVSAVGIPANPDALQLGLSAGAIDRADLQELLEVLTPLARARGGSHFGSHTAAAAPHTSALRGRGDGAQWLRLAHELKRLLR